MTIFFTSDTHFGHKNILHLGHGRPFSSIEEHDEELIKRWNSVVTPQDTVYHLGDVGFCKPQRIVEIFNRLNGTIHILRGNHDDTEVGIYATNVAAISDYKELRHNGQMIVLCHYPILEWNGAYKGAWHLHGHTHGSLHPDFVDHSVPRLDVAVDCWDFTPASVEQIAEKMADKQWKPLSHHGKGKKKT